MDVKILSHPALPLVILLLLIRLYTIAYLAPVVGDYHDDGIYLATAKSIAEGNGYRIASLPEEIPQTKYPFLFPALLAVVWWVFPVFPANVPALKLVPLLFGVLWGWAVWLAFRERLGQGGAAWLGVLTLALPWSVYLSSTLLSEMLFAAFTWLALGQIGRPSDKLRTKETISAGALASAAFLARTTGIALIIAGVLALASRRAWKQAALFLGTSVALCSPWAI